MSAPLHPPLSFTWGQYVAGLVAERGGLAELARSLVEVAPAGVKLSDDPLTVERGLRRLRDLGSAPGGRYGRLLIRCFGIPGTISDWARRMGQYHSRLADLPVAVRHEQLRLWDRPPISESSVAAWVHLGLASLAHRQRDAEQLDTRMSLAKLVARSAGPDALMELALLQARLAADRGEADAAQGFLDAAGSALSELEAGEAACYLARLQDQRAYLTVRGWRKAPEHLDAALALYAVIPIDGPPFARFRRAHGEAWCLWKQGRKDEALSASRLAVQHAGDGGFVRMRILALTLQGHILGRAEGGAVWMRAREMAEALGDDLLTAKIPRR
ncbi:MAG: hypothetical protein ACI8RZ_007174 [Myxococcota bacterium]|jgi:hypothetical protein